MPKILPTAKHKNLLICVSGIGGSKEHSVFISNCIIDLNCLDAGTQCFPLYYYEQREKVEQSLFNTFVMMVLLILFSIKLKNYMEIKLVRKIYSSMYMDFYIYQNTAKNFLLT